MQAVVTLLASPPKNYDAETTRTQLFYLMCMNDCMNGKDIALCLLFDPINMFKPNQIVYIQKVAYCTNLNQLGLLVF